MSVSQNLFSAAILDPGAPVPAGLSDGAARPAGRRFNVYRNNVAVSLTEALHKTFPIITRLLGHENMDGLSGLFLRQHPPTSPLMMFYGFEFPNFLAGMEQLSHLGYLADVARLELAQHRSYHAADAAAIDPDLLAGCGPEQLMAATLEFAPAMKILRSDWPIYDIWRFNTAPDAPKPSPGPQDILITRPEFDPIPHLLPPGGAHWISALLNGQSIAAAHGGALTEDPEFDLGATLALLLQGGAVIAFNSKDEDQ